MVCKIHLEYDYTCMYYTAVSSNNNMCIDLTYSTCHVINRRCHLTEFGFTLAAFDIMFINMSRRHPACDTGRASLNFNGFCESLIAIGHKKFSLTMRREPVQILLTVLKHCEQHLQMGKAMDAPSRQRTCKAPFKLSDRKMQSCFHLPTSPLIKGGIL